MSRPGDISVAGPHIYLGELYDLSDMFNSYELEKACHLYGEYWDPEHTRQEVQMGIAESIYNNIRKAL